MRRKRRRFLFLVFPLSVIFLLVAVFRTKVDPLIEELAVATVSDVASNVINDAINVQITEGDIQYSDLVTLEHDNSGNITALTTDVQEMNRLKTQLLEILDDDIYDINDDTISVPMGNLTGIQLLSGRGPKIPVKIVAISDSDANFVGDFSDAGINQTIHRIMLNVALDLVILLPSGTVTDHVSTDVCVAETVLLGPVPDSYTYFNSTGDTISDAKYFASE